MTIRYKVAHLFSFAAIAVITLGGFVGCAKSEPKVAKTPTTTSESTPDASPHVQITPDQTETAREALTGVWLGEAYIDEAALEAKLKDLTPAYQESTIAKARSFLSTVMAIDFRSDGSIENEIELVSLDGQILREGASGAWKVVEADKNGAVVETQENFADGSIATNRGYYQFQSDGKIALAVPVAPELEGCNALLVFERRTLPPTNVAEQPANSQTR